VETPVRWRKPMGRHKGLDLPEMHLPESEATCAEVISRPLSGETTPEHADIVMSAIQKLFGRRT
jgi:dTDP-4-amino-4,6-dideoxygalactose transaminase